MTIQSIPDNREKEAIAEAKALLQQLSIQDIATRWGDQQLKAAEIQIGYICNDIAATYCKEAKVSGLVPVYLRDAVKQKAALLYIRCSQSTQQNLKKLYQLEPE